MFSSFDEIVGAVFGRDLYAAPTLKLMTHHPGYLLLIRKIYHPSLFSDPNN
jgi:hypothetical protein